MPDFVAKRNRAAASGLNTGVSPPKEKGTTYVMPFFCLFSSA
jgi:hypothetical protein